MASEPEKVVLLRTWIQNIGNGFIDKGARVILQRAFPDAEIVEASGHPNYVGDIKASLGLRQKLGLDRSDHRRVDHPYRQRTLNVAEYMDADLIVLPGCILSDWVFRKYAATFDRLDTQDTPVIFLGAGGGDYEATTRETTRKFLDRFDVDALLTRDDEAYESYADDVEFSYSGIDCAFYINEWFDAPDSTEKFTAHTFDKTDEPERLNPENTVVRPDHSPFGQPFEIYVRREVSNLLGNNDYEKENVLYSDRLEDYLFVYANSEVTHSDRVHACVPTLAYGGKAKFYFSTPRAGLFEKVIDQDITEQVVSLNQDRVAAEKQDQVAAVREAYEAASQ